MTPLLPAKEKTSIRTIGITKLVISVLCPSPGHSLVKWSVCLLTVLWQLFPLVSIRTVRDMPQLCLGSRILLLTTTLSLPTRWVNRWPRPISSG